MSHTNPFSAGPTTRNRKPHRDHRRPFDPVEALESRTLLSITPVGPELRVNRQDTTATAVDVASDGGGFVVAWQESGVSGDGGGSSSGIYAQHLTDAGERLGETLTVRGDSAGGLLLGPSVAANGRGDFVVTWAGRSARSLLWTVFAQQYDRDGTPLGGTVRADGASSRLGGRPEVAIDGSGEFVLAWTAFRPGGVARVDIQYFEATGARRGGVHVVDVIEKGKSPDDATPSVAMDGDGRFVVAWSRFGTNDPIDRRGPVVYAQRFDAAGQRLGGTIVPGSRPIPQLTPCVAMNSCGDFILGWIAAAPTGGRFCFERYNASGQRLGGESRASAGGNAADPSVTMDDNGQFALAWRSQGRYRESDAIYARVYDPEGGAATGPFRVSTSAPGYPQQPVVALGAAGRSLVAWTGFSPAGEGRGVYVQRLQRFDHAARVFGTTWNDADGDGIHESGEAPRGGVAVRLFNEFGALAGTATTDLRGAYAFDVRPGVGYYLAFGSPQTVFSPQFCGGDGGVDSYVDPDTGRTSVFTIDPSWPSLSLDAGIRAAPCSRFGGAAGDGSPCRQAR